MNILALSAVPETVLETDIAIIGGGPAGLCVAAHLSRDCIVIESGTIGTDIRTHHVFHSVNTGEPSKIDAVRVRGIGGASLRWTGRCIPLDPYDFENRPWISATGWPIGYEELSQWSVKAARLMELPDDDSFLGHPQRSWEGDRFVPAVWRFSENKARGVLRFGDHLKPAFKGAGRRILYEAHAVEIMANHKEAKALRVMARDGRSVLIKARHFVIASGCVETCRMLLATQRANPQLLGEVTAWLGKGFGQHLRLDAGEVMANPAQLSKLQGAFDIQRAAGCAVTETGLALNPAFARDNQLGNASLVLRYAPQRGLSPLDWWGSAKARLDGKAVQYRKAKVFVEIDSEQVVDQTSFIGLAEETDPLGMPRARVHWKINETDCRTAYHTMTAFARLIDKAGLGRMLPADGIRPDSVDLKCRRDSLHQLGGTRMSESSAHGVVDKNLTIHGTANISVVGGSVFATGGHANPTQTIVALALRLAEHLNDKANSPTQSR